MSTTTDKAEIHWMGTTHLQTDVAVLYVDHPDLTARQQLLQVQAHRYPGEIAKVEAAERLDGAIRPLVRVSADQARALAEALVTAADAADALSGVAFPKVTPA